MVLLWKIISLTVFVARSENTGWVYGWAGRGIFGPLFTFSRRGCIRESCYICGLCAWNIICSVVQKMPQVRRGIFEQLDSSLLIQACFTIMATLKGRVPSPIVCLHLSFTPFYGLSFVWAKVHLRELQTWKSRQGKTSILVNGMLSVTLHVHMCNALHHCIHGKREWANSIVALMQMP